MLNLTDKEIFIIGDFIKKYLDEKYPCTTEDNCDTKLEDVDIEKVHNKICYYIHSNKKNINMKNIVKKVVLSILLIICVIFQLEIVYEVIVSHALHFGSVVCFGVIALFEVMIYVNLFDND